MNLGISYVLRNFSNINIWQRILPQWLQRICDIAIQPPKHNASMCGLKPPNAYIFKQYACILGRDDLRTLFTDYSQSKQQDLQRMFLDILCNMLQNPSYQIIQGVYDVCLNDLNRQMGVSIVDGDIKTKLPNAHTSDQSLIKHPTMQRAIAALLTFCDNDTAWMTALSKTLHQGTVAIFLRFIREQKIIQIDDTEHDCIGNTYTMDFDLQRINADTIRVNLTYQTTIKLVCNPNIDSMVSITEDSFINATACYDINRPDISGNVAINVINADLNSDIIPDKSQPF